LITVPILIILSLLLFVSKIKQNRLFYRGCEERFAASFDNEEQRSTANGKQTKKHNS